MAIEIRIESGWDTDDGEGRSVEVTVLERARPSDDPVEHARYFASGDVEALKHYVAELIDRGQRAFAPPRRRECVRCLTPRPTASIEPRFVCDACRALA